jgi:hypothetical protein
MRIESVILSETSVSSYQNARRHKMVLFIFLPLNFQTESREQRACPPSTTCESGTSFQLRVKYVIVLGALAS